MKTILKFNQPAVLVSMAFMCLTFAGCGRSGSKQGADEETTHALVQAAGSNPTFLTVSDVHLDLSVPFNSPGCDADQALWQSAVTKYNAIIANEKPGFVLYLGDLPAHASQQGCNHKVVPLDIHKAIGDVLGDLRTNSVASGVPLLYLPGNNDSYGGDYNYFTDTLSPGKYVRPFDLDPAGASQWPIINPPKGKAAKFIDGNSEFGYYSAYPLGTPGSGVTPLRVLMLNTVLFNNSSGNQMSFKNQQAAANTMMDWIATQLSQAAGKEKVILAMHIPPGLDGFSGSQNWKQSLMYKSTGITIEAAFLNLVGKYSADITGILTSHTHTDDFKRVWDAKNNLLEVTISTPGITIDHGNNPGMKIFEYSSTDYSLIDARTYYCKENPAGIFSDWSSPPYSFCKTYGYSGTGGIMGCVQSISGAPGSNPCNTTAAVVTQMKQVLLCMKNPGKGTYQTKSLDWGLLSQCP